MNPIFYEKIKDKSIENVVITLFSMRQMSKVNKKEHKKWATLEVFY